MGFIYELASVVVLAIMLRRLPHPTFTMIIFAVMLLLATCTVRADPCAFFEVEFGKKYNVKPNPDSFIRATRTYPLDIVQCINNGNAGGCCTTDGKYMSIHTEILDNTKPKKGETATTGSKVINFVTANVGYG